MNWRASLALLQSKGGKESIRFADDSDLITGSKDKLTDLTSLLAYQHYRHFMDIRMETSIDLITTTKGEHCTRDKIIETRCMIEVNNFQYRPIGSTLSEEITLDVEIKKILNLTNFKTLHIKYFLRVKVNLLESLITIL